MGFLKKKRKASSSPTSNDLHSLQIPEIAFALQHAASPSSNSVPGAGFLNAGNTCYVNATLQALFHIDKFTALLQDEDPAKFCKKQASCLVCTTRQTFQQHRTTKISFRPGVLNFLEDLSPRFKQKTQQDAQEFLIQFLSGLKSSNEIHEAHIALDLFNFTINSTTICGRCNKESVTQEPYNILQVSIDDCTTLGAALDQHFVKEDIVGYTCEECSIPVGGGGGGIRYPIGGSTKQLSINTLPEIIIIQLKRFTNSRRKLNNKIQYDEMLDMSPYLAPTKDEGSMYNYVGSVIHSGTLHSGHYTSIVKAEDGKYYLFNDHSVQKVAIKKSLDPSAYLLFFERDHLDRDKGKNDSDGTNDDQDAQQSKWKAKNYMDKTLESVWICQQVDMKTGLICAMKVSRKNRLLHEYKFHSGNSSPKAKKKYNYIEKNLNDKSKHRKVICQTLIKGSLCNMEVDAGSLHLHDIKYHTDGKSPPTPKKTYKYTPKDPKDTSRNRKVICQEQNLQKIGQACGMEVPVSHYAEHYHKHHELTLPTNTKRNYNYILKDPKGSVRNSKVICKEKDILTGSICNKEVQGSTFGRHFDTYHTPGRIPLSPRKNYKFTLKDPGDKSIDPRVMCQELDILTRQKCHMEVARDNMHNHYQRHHETNPTARNNFHLALLASQRFKSVTIYYTHYLTKNGAKLPLIEKGNQMTEEVKEIFEDVSIINRGLADVAKTENYLPYHATVMIAYKCNGEKEQNMTFQEIFQLHQDDHSSKFYVFFDTSEDIGPCPAYHFSTDSSSPMTKKAVSGFEIYIMRIVFDGHPTLANMHNALQFQYGNVMCGMHRRVFVDNPKTAKYRMLNKNLLNKNRHKSFVESGPFLEGFTSAMNGDPLFPIKGYAHRTFEKFIYPGRATYAKSVASLEPDEDYYYDQLATMS